MTLYIQNQLKFFSNSRTILRFLESGQPDNGAPDRFTLNSITSMPTAFGQPVSEPVKELSLMNLSFPELKGKTAEYATSEIYRGRTSKATQAEIQAAIDTLLQKDGTQPGDDLTVTLANYKKYGFFSYYDWRLTNWGTLKDVHSIVESTFQEDTRFIEFVTEGTPPIAALKSLANTFPSVRFELMYRSDNETDWIKLEIFPLNPFGY